MAIEWIDFFRVNTLSSGYIGTDFNCYGFEDNIERKGSIDTCKNGGADGVEGCVFVIGK
jgi:hypothetical protein